MHTTECHSSLLYSENPLLVALDLLAVLNRLWGITEYDVGYA